MRCPIVLCTTGLLLGLGPAMIASAQDYTRDRDRGEGRRRGFSMESLDANGDGLLQESELPERMRDRFREMGERAGVKPGEPIPLSAMSRFGRRRDDDDDRREDRRGPESPATTTPATTTPANSTPSDTTATPVPADAATTSPTPTPAENKSEPAPPLVPGFGIENTLAAVPGFGVALDSTEESKPGSANGAGGSSSAAKSETSPESLERVKRYALSLMRQYDKNKNNILDPDEWKEMRGDPAQADTNKDGIITLDELTERLASYGRRRDTDSSGGSGGSGNSGESNANADAGQAKSLYRNGPKKLPEGLPSWFATRDKNADAQVSMAEYSSTWTDSLAAEFRRYDTNNDGVITTREALASTQSSSTESGSGSSASSPSSSSGTSDAGRSSSGGFGERRRGFGSRD